MFRRRNDPPETGRRPLAERSLEDRTTPLSDDRRPEDRRPEDRRPDDRRPGDTVPNRFAAAGAPRPGPLEPNAARPVPVQPIPAPPPIPTAQPAIPSPAQMQPTPVAPSQAQTTQTQPTQAETPAQPGAKPGRPDEKRLTVGHDICLSGQITACDKLVVEGTVDATLSDSRKIEIGESGIFRGSAEIDEAEIAGRFDGSLSVRGRLFIRATGKVKGEVRYGQLEIELGGVLTGNLDTSAAANDAGQPPRAAAKEGEAPAVREEAV